MLILFIILIRKLLKELLYLIYNKEYSKQNDTTKSMH